MLNHYRIFKKEAAKTLAPLNEIVKGRTRKNDRTPVPWTPQLEQIFENAKKLFSEFTLLHYPRNDSILYLVGDASNEAVGAVLEQDGEGGEREPIGYFSEKLDDTKKNGPLTIVSCMRYVQVHWHSSISSKNIR